MPPTNSSIIGTVQNEFKKEATTNYNTALPAMTLFKAPPLVNPPPSGTYRIVLPAVPFETNQFVCKFFVALTGGNSPVKHAQARLTGIRRQIVTGFTSEYAATYLATLDLVAGNTTANTGSFTSGGPYNLVERVNIIDDQTNTPPGLRLVGTVTDGWVEVSFDTAGYSEIWIELSNLDPTGGGHNTTLVGFVWSTL